VRYRERTEQRTRTRIGRQVHVGGKDIAAQARITCSAAWALAFADGRGVDGGQGRGDVLPEVAAELGIAHKGHGTVRHRDATVVAYSLVRRDPGCPVGADVVVVVVFESEDGVGNGVVATDRRDSDADARKERRREDQGQLVGQPDVDEGFVFPGVLVVIWRGDRERIRAARIDPVVAAGGCGVARVVRADVYRSGLGGAGVWRAGAA